MVSIEQVSQLVLWIKPWSKVSHNSSLRL